MILDVDSYIDNIFGETMHAKRVQSLANATKGVIESGSLTIHAIGAGLAQANDLKRKYAIKQVDRLLSNPKLDLWQRFHDWVPFIIANRKEIIVSMDWTEFDSDDHCTIVLSLQTEHGRNTPLLWKTHKQSGLKGNRNDYEDELLRKLHGCIPAGVKVTIVADRGFSDTALYHFIKQGLDFDYVIRMKGNTKVTDIKNNTASVSDYLTQSGRTKSLKEVKLTANKYPVAQVICTKKKGMKAAWFLASSRADLKAQKILDLYSNRWGIECSFRDIKDYKFGMGMSHMHTRSTKRRDVLFLLSALAIVLLTLLGKAGDQAGLEKHIKANTVKKRTYSFWRQGCIYYELLPGMKDDMLLPLMKKFHGLLVEQPYFMKVLGVL